MDVQEVSLAEIDADVIEPIRGVDKGTRGYEKLKYAIEKNGQLHPITLRELTSEEQSRAKNKDAKYGIIDGHHRFAIARDNNKATILAQIEGALIRGITITMIRFWHTD